MHLHAVEDQRECNKLMIGNVLYIEVRNHKCSCNCIDSGQTEKDWIEYLRSLPDYYFLKKRVSQIMEHIGYTNLPKGEGYCKIG